MLSNSILVFRYSLKALILIIETFQECFSNRLFMKISSICLFTSVSSWLKHIGRAIVTGIIDESCRGKYGDIWDWKFRMKTLLTAVDSRLTQKKRRKTFSCFFIAVRKLSFLKTVNGFWGKNSLDVHNVTIWEVIKTKKKETKFYLLRGKKLKNVLGIKKFIAVQAAWNLKVYFSNDSKARDKVWRWTLSLYRFCWRS